ncbi:hypothetical protein A9Q81_16775 [Gammaproteobacteria bacterium 42_54_T18]|mgnify:FL=1|nr:hypothetical protein A9Q81_16775 [Gammaproteobacteria bacterium 42_54_T18]
MSYSKNIVLILQDETLSNALAPGLESAVSVVVHQHQSISKALFENNDFGLAILDIKKNSFLNLSRLVKLFHENEQSIHFPPLLLLTDDKSIKTVTEFTDLGVVGICRSDDPLDLLSYQVKRIYDMLATIENTKEQLNNARNVAMLSMSASSQLGEVVRFQEQSYKIIGYSELGELLRESFKLLGVDCAGIIWVGKRSYYFGDRDEENLVTTLLTTASRSKERYVQHEDNTMVFFESIWVYVTNMPPVDSEEHGQLKDSLFPLIEGAGMRAYSIHADKMATIAERNKAWFLKNMSHELRTPMGAIMSGVTLLRRKRAGSDNQESQVVDLMDKSANRLTDLIEDLLALSDIENIHVAKKNFAVPDLLVDTLDFYDRWASSKSITFTHNFINIDSKVFLDPKHLKQILRSLLSNAVKYTNEGHVSLEVEQLKKEEGDCLKVMVTDTGAGFNMDEAQDFLKPFIDLDERAVQQGAGSGLGLSVVYQLMKQLNGTLDVQSESGKGSVFTLEFPIDYSEDAEQLLFS